VQTNDISKTDMFADVNSRAHGLVNIFDAGHGIFTRFLEGQPASRGIMCHSPKPNSLHSKPYTALLRESLLVFNTGRSLDSVKALMKEKRLLTPTAVIGSVGTEVWWSDGEGGFKMDEVGYPKP